MKVRGSVMISDSVWLVMNCCMIQFVYVFIMMNLLCVMLMICMMLKVIVSLMVVRKQIEVSDRVFSDRFVVCISLIWVFVFCSVVWVVEVILVLGLIYRLRNWNWFSVVVILVLLVVG